MPRTRVTPEPPIYTVRVRIRGGFSAPPDAEAVWRELEVAANQTLADLGTAIPEAFGFTDPHLWFLFLFDYGDEWHFGVQLVGTSATVAPGTRYPRVVASAGAAPPQYPEEEDD